MDCPFLDLTPGDWGLYWVWDLIKPLYFFSLHDNENWFVICHLNLKSRRICGCVRVLHFTHYVSSVLVPHRPTLASILCPPGNLVSSDSQSPVWQGLTPAPHSHNTITTPNLNQWQLQSIWRSHRNLTVTCWCKILRFVILWVFPTDGSFNISCFMLRIKSRIELLEWGLVWLAPCHAERGVVNTTETEQSEKYQHPHCHWQVSRATHSIGQWPAIWKSVWQTCSS